MKVNIVWNTTYNNKFQWNLIIKKGQRTGVKDIISYTEDFVI